jgi:hypothetical protein
LRLSLHPAAAHASNAIAKNACFPVTRTPRADDRRDR